MPLEYGDIHASYNGQYIGKVKDTTLSFKDTQHKAYKEGYEAYNSDIADKDALCPYPIGNPIIGLRQRWFTGLYDNKYSKYDHIPEATNEPTNSKTKTKNTRR